VKYRGRDEFRSARGRSPRFSGGSWTSVSQQWFDPTHKPAKATSRSALTSTRSALRRAAVHEAGHVLADYLHGFFPVEVAIGRGESSGEGRTDCRDRVATVVTVEKFIVSCFAGSAAERLLVGEDDSTAIGEHSDRHKAALAFAAAELSGDLEVFAERARELVTVTRNASAISAIADELESHQVLRGTALQFVIADALGVAAVAKNPVDKWIQHAPERLGVLRWQGGTVYPPRYFGTEVVDAIVLGDLESMRADGTSVIVQPQNGEDAERLEALATRGDVVLEYLDGSEDVLSIAGIERSAAGFLLVPFETIC
jgi:hypothetical protein